MPSRILLATVLALLVAACGPLTGDEVARTASPDGRLDAVLFEINGGATTDFAYEVAVVEKGNKDGERVARLYGATRNDSAYGANLKWAGDTELVVEFMTARDQKPPENGTIRVLGRDVRIVLRSGVSDPDAPPGGMLYNLRQRK